MDRKEDQGDTSSDLLPQFSSNHWEQFEKFRKRICQEEETRSSYSQLERISKQQAPSPTPTPNVEADRVLKLRLENQELREQLAKNEKQLKEAKEKYEEENKELIVRLSQFTDELEELKKVYKDKNMKLYNLVLQLEKEKQELIDKNISMLEQKQQQQKPILEEKHLQNLVRSLQDQVRVLEEKNAKLLFEKAKQPSVANKENILMTPTPKPMQHFRESVDKPPRQFVLEQSNRGKALTKDKVVTDKSKKKKRPKTPKQAIQPQSTKSSARNRSFSKFENQTPVQKKKILKRSSTNSNFDVVNSQSLLKSRDSCLKKSTKKLIPRKKN